MAERGDTHYSVRGLNLWFLISSVLLLGTTVWTVLDDWNRGWKGYQREFRRIELSRATSESQQLTQQGALEREGELHKGVLEAQGQVDARAAEVRALEDQLRASRGLQWSAIEAAKKAKSEFNWDRYLIEEQRLHRGDPEFQASALRQSEKRMNERIGAQQEAEAEVREVRGRLDAQRSDLEQARARLAAGTRDLDRVRKRLETLAPTEAAARLADVLRDAPGLDFIEPNLKVSKIVLDDLTFELNFTKKKRIDMCTTCHLGIDRAGFEDQPQPFRTHPRLDLYLTAKSPHPQKQVGCTICHRGSGEALDFVRADHRPDTQAQAEEWEHDHHWYKQHHWDYPMLERSRTEASCVQCHKTSMELIAEDAPTVSQGFHLVERYGCYACHKIDWFPTKRRPGPTLKNLQAKLTPEFLSAWIKNPKDFRPSTWMPQFFHLENYAAEESVVVSQYGEGREILGAEWDDAAIDAVAAFLIDRAPKRELPPVPVEGDARRGAEVMRLSGCWACHNVAPFGGEEPQVRDLSEVKRGTNEHGPNLRGVATKLNAAWLYWWIKDPQSYWPGTRMPNLRLSDQDAADITTYILEDPDLIFRDVPPTWKPAKLDMDPAREHEVLAEQARWYFAREGRAAIAARLSGADPAHPWNDLETLKVAVGEKVVGNYGCFSCHEISGLESMMPIGTELTTWGSKEVAKLDFGFGVSEFGLDHDYREGWLVQKLHAPRSFDQKKVKNPTEKLRMPWFNFTDEEASAITTFVVGLVDDEVQRARMRPDAADLSMDAGLRAVRQNNCLACHMVEPGTLTYQDEEGAIHRVEAELLGVGDEPVPPAHDLAALKAELEFQEQDEAGFRILRPEPEVDLSVGDKLFVPGDKVLALGAPRGGDLVRLITDYYLHGQELFDPEAASEDERFYFVTADPDDELKVQDVDGVFRDRQAEPYDKIRWTFAPPVLWDEGGKVKKDWFYSFLNDVVPLRPQIRVRMPSFSFQEGEAEGIASYFAHQSAKEWPTRYARSLRLELDLTVDEMAALAPGLTPQAVVGIEAGSAPDIAASFAKLRSIGEAKGFAFPPAVDPLFDASRLRASAYLAERAGAEPDHLRLGERLAVEAVNCFQCHFRLGAPPAAEPIAWAPDLARVHERLREDWLAVWLQDPAKVYPGTAMPANFAGDPPQYQEIYPGSTNADQIRVVLEWLYNFDRISMASLSQ